MKRPTPLSGTARLYYVENKTMGKINLRHLMDSSPHDIGTRGSVSHGEATVSPLTHVTSSLISSGHRGWMTQLARDDTKIYFSPTRQLTIPEATEHMVHGFQTRWSWPRITSSSVLGLFGISGPPPPPASTALAPRPKPSLTTLRMGKLKICHFGGAQHHVKPRRRGRPRTATILPCPHG